MTLLIAVLFGLVMIAADQFTKILVLNTFAKSTDAITVIPGVVSFYHVDNTGAGFSILEGKTLFLVIFTVICIAVVIWIIASRKCPQPIMDWGLCLIVSGGLGNLIDRVFRGGAVVDFIRTDFIDFPVFNVADICITIGAALVIIYFIWDYVREIKHKKVSGNGKD